MNGKVTLTLNNVTYNVLAIVPDTNHFGKIASIYMCKPHGRNIYKTILFDNWVIRNWHFTTSGKIGDKEFAEIQAQSIPFNDDIIPPQQPAAPTPNTLESTFDKHDLEYAWDDLSKTEQLALFNLANGAAFLPFKVWNSLFDKGLVNSDGDEHDYLTANGWFFVKSHSQSEQYRELLKHEYPPEEQSELDTLRAELDAARADVVTLTAENRLLHMTGKRLLQALDDQFLPANPNQFLPGTQEYVSDVERLEAAKVFNGEVNS